MMYPYMTLADETEIVHSQIVEENGKKKVIVNFERPTEDGFQQCTSDLSVRRKRRGSDCLVYLLSAAIKLSRRRMQRKSG